MSRRNPVALARARSLRPTFLLASLLAVLPLATGCAHMAGPPRRSDAAGLSDAAEETKKKPEEHHKVLPVAPPPPSPPVVTTTAVFVESDPDYVAEPRMAAPPKPHRRFLQGWRLGVVGGAGAMGGSIFEPTGELGLKLAYSPSRLDRFDLDLTGTAQRFQTTTGLVGAFTEPMEFGADLSYRHAITRNGHPIGIAPMIGMRFGTEMWDYRNGVWVDDGSGPAFVTDDMLDTYSPYLGLGLTLFDSPRLQLGAAIKGGMTFYDKQSFQGFDNDVFPNTGFLRVQVETSFPF